MNRHVTSLINSDIITAVDELNSSFCVLAARMNKVSDAFWNVNVTSETYLRNTLWDFSLGNSTDDSGRWSSSMFTLVIMAGGGNDDDNGVDDGCGGLSFPACR